MIPLSNQNMLRIALICSHGLGDMLIQMVIAKNLVSNGYEVHVYSDFAYQIRNYFHCISIHPFPPPQQLKNECADKHIILYDAGSKSYLARLPLELEKWLARRGICFSLSSSPPVHTTITFDDIKSYIPLDKQSDARRFMTFNRRALKKDLFAKRPPVVEQICRFLSDYIRLQNVSTDNGLTVPKVNRNRRRVVIHPTSGSEKKNWHASSYLSLAQTLKARGWHVVFTVAQAELQIWKSLTQGAFECPLYPTIEELLIDYNQSTGFIGNDSGNGHLASNLGLPTLTVFHRGRRYPKWRPGWGTTKVLIAPFPYGLSKTRWKDHIHSDRVVEAFEQLVVQQ